jgi:DNA mismatch repair protein MutS
MRQHATFKARHPDCVLLFRMGDFYELFDDDAVLANRVLGLTLTQRTEGIPMAGVPYHQLDTYLRRLIDAGHRVAVCDQVQDPKEAKGVVERAVTRVVTPGTLVEESLLDEGAPSALAAVCFDAAGDDADARVGVAVVELSTGRFSVFAAASAEVADELARRSVREVLHAEANQGDAPPRVARILERVSVPGTPRPSWHFRTSDAGEALRTQFGVSTLAAWDLDDHDPEARAAGAIVRYLRETQAMDEAHKATSEGFSSGSAGAAVVRRRTLTHLSAPRRDDLSRFVRMDAASVRALEIQATVRESDGAGSLVGIFARDGCRTPMGRRLVREWLCRPSAERGVIEGRHAAVATLVQDDRVREALDASLAPVQDVARVAARVGLARATPRDVVALGRSLAQAGALVDALAASPALARLHGPVDAVREELIALAARIGAVCADDPPASMREGGVIRAGVDAALDEARSLRADSGAWLAQYQARLVEEHNLPSLRVGYNRIFGFYIELPRGQASRAPAAFSRRQTLKDAERFITPELKTYEDRVVRSEEDALRREQAIFAGVCESIVGSATAIGVFGEVAAEADALACFARKARLRGWTRPEMVDEPVLVLTDARHPVLEDVLADRFVPNDCALGPGARCALITGPNMAGKSTYIRQVALITVLAHAGSFVPAAAARIGLTDRIATRIGADDALHRGQSTFMVEMVETASILHHATQRTLVILDEIGRGTSTLDGLSLAWAIAEHLSSDASARPRTLFATHYHELTTLADEHGDRVINLHVVVREHGDEIAFLHRIAPGRTDRSYGIHVAKLAGLPAPVVARAKQVLESLSVSHESAPRAPAPRTDRNGHGAQLGLFTMYAPHPVIEEIKALDLSRLSPMDAFDRLRSLQGRAGESAPSE